VVDALAEQLKRVLAEPDAIEPRLAYASLLDMSDPRRWLIEWQCQMAALKSWDDTYRFLDGLARGAIYRHQDAWTRDIVRYCSTPWFIRGFVESVAIDDRSFDANAEALFSLAPIQELRCDGSLGDVPRSSWLRRITRLSVRRLSNLAEIAETEHAASLQVLSYDGDDGDGHFWLGTESCERLASGTMTSLRRLELSHALRDDAGLVALTRATSLPALTELRLWANGRLVAGVHSLASSNLARRMRVLSMDCDEECAEALVRGSYPALEELRIDGSFCRTAGTALARLDAPSLRVLDLTGVRVDVAAARALAARSFPRLEELVLASCELDDEGARVIGDAPWLGQLVRVELVANGKLTEAAKESLLGKCTGLPPLEPPPYA
jgi:hypothetical protein